MTYTFSEKTPGIFSFKQIEEVENFISLKTKEIEESQNPRLIVMETWFIVDWLVRQIIISGINCLDLKTGKFYPHYKLLPNSFRECVDCLINLIKSQKNLKPKPNPRSDSLSSSYELWKFIEKEAPKTFKKIIKLEKVYQRKKYKIPKNKDFAILDPNEAEYRYVSEQWLKSVTDIDPNWFDKALKLNKVRNVAAHAFEEVDLYKTFGINGKNKTSKLRKECLDLLSVTTGLIKIN